MKKAEIKTRRFADRDVIATSTRTLTLSGFEDSVTGNNVMNFNGTAYTQRTLTALNQSLNKAERANVLSLDGATELGSTSKVMNTGRNNPGYNGVYVWDPAGNGGSGWFVREAQ